MNKSAIILSGLAMLLSACSTQRINTVQSNLLIGEWQQPNVSLKIEANGKYHYIYSADGYTSKQSGRYYGVEVALEFIFNKKTGNR